jgi:secondary thiamine-phosphate synthase enzyme
MPARQIFDLSCAGSAQAPRGFHRRTNDDVEGAPVSPESRFGYGKATERGRAMRVETTGEAPLSRVVNGRLSVSTRGEGFTDLDRAMADWLEEIAAGDGVVIACVAHTTASLLVQENADPDVRADLVASLHRLAPRGAAYRHALEGVDDMPAHIRAMLTDTAVSLPVRAGRAATGTWQTLYLVEHRDAPRTRTVTLTYLGS